MKPNSMHGLFCGIVAIFLIVAAFWLWRPRVMEGHGGGGGGGGGGHGGGVGGGGGHMGGGGYGHGHMGGGGYGHRGRGGGGIGGGGSYGGYYGDGAYDINPIMLGSVPDYYWVVPTSEAVYTENGLEPGPVFRINSSRSASG